MYIKKLLTQYSDSKYNYSLDNECDVEKINANSAKWVFKNGLVCGKIFERYKKINTGLFSKLTYPYNDPNSLEIIQLGSDLISWLFLFDDEHGEGRVHVGEDRFIEKSELIEKLNSYRKLLETEKLPTNRSPFHISILDFIKRVEKLNPDKKWKSRFSKAMGLYFDGCIEEYDYRRGFNHLNIETYFNIRSKSIGAYPVFELITLYQGSNPYEIENEYNSDLLEKYLYHGALLCSWVNDLFSLDKEISEKEANNLVMVLKNEYALKDYDLAREKACEFNKADLNQLKTIKNIYFLTNSLHPQLNNFLNRVRLWTIGNLYWTIITRRYKLNRKDIEVLFKSVNKLNLPDKITELFNISYLTSS
ncbi:MAG: terpene synthase family protein [Promethearchaeota archaeon]